MYVPTIIITVATGLKMYDGKMYDQALMGRDEKHKTIAK